MPRRKPQSPTQRREALEATAGRAAQEKDERVVADMGHDTRIGNLLTRMSNQEAVNTAQQTNIVALLNRMSDQEAVNTAQQTNIVSLLDFRNRAAGFAVQDHDHDLRYYGRGTTDIWFLRTVTHPLGVQLHGPGYHA